MERREKQARHTRRRWALLGRGNRLGRKPRANNAYFRALKRSPKDAVDTGNPLHYDDFPSDAPLA